ncbi:MAG TPA: iron-containing redox enzyme family protein [Gammaproteobacteria bacterium]|nr:iron-containing redox enzyme family protein [Gammaproteobacteria bacterium]
MMLAFDMSQLQEVINLIEKDQQVAISIRLPKSFLFKNILEIDHAYHKISELTPMITNLAKTAFIEQNKTAWKTVQLLLYYWNYRDLMRIDRVKDNTILVEYALRKIILDIQMNYAPCYSLECVNDFTPERAVQELADKVYSHRINKHPLLEEMVNHGMSPSSVRLFLENYYVNNRLFHLFIAGLCFCTPMAKRTELANNFYDEMGAGDTDMAHPTLFLKNFNTIKLPTIITPLPESVYLVNAKTYAAFLSGDYHYGMGGFGYIELAMPNQMRKILAGLEKSGLPRSDLEFWETHISIDVEHGKTWFSEMLDLIKTAEHAQKCLTGGMHLLEARATMYDGILNCQS